MARLPYLEADQVAPEYRDMLARNTHNVRGVISEVIPLEETPNAFPRLRSGEALKVVVTP